MIRHTIANRKSWNHDACLTEVAYDGHRHTPRSPTASSRRWDQGEAAHHQPLHSQTQLLAHPNSPHCFNVTTVGYGTVQRCKFGRICEVCRGTPGRQNCTFVRVTGKPAELGAQTSLSNVVVPSD